MADMTLAGRIALITGGAGAIGTAVATRFLAAGARVALCDADGERARQVAAQLGDGAMGLAMDVCEPESVSAALGAIERALGPVDVLANIAGIIRNAPVTSMTMSEWHSVVDVNMTGTFVVSREVSAGMIARGYGRIVNVSSGSARGSTRGQANYSAAKAGIIGLTRTLAFELGPDGITVNAVAPGAIRSDMTKATADQIGQDYDAYERAIAAGTALRRLGEPDDVADVIRFLASDAARFVTGAVIPVTGGTASW